MKKEEKSDGIVQKKWWIVCMAALVLVVAIFCSIGILSAAKVPKPTDGEIALYVMYDGEKETYPLYATDKGVYEQLVIDSQELTTLYVANGRKEIDSLQVIVSDSDGNTVSEKTFSSSDKEWILELEKEALEIESTETYDVSFVVTDAENMEFYIAAEEQFLSIIADRRVENQSVYMMTDMTITDAENEWIICNYPFIWNFGKNSFITESNIRFQSTNSGEMHIHNSEALRIETGLIVCDTPEWKYQIEELFGTFAEEQYYYIKAQCVNERQIDITSLLVDSEEKLQGILQVSASDSANKFSALVLPEEVTDLKIVGDYEIGKVRTDRELTLELSGNSNVIVEGANVHLIWTGEYAPTMEDVEKYMYVKSFNEKEMNPYIGGDISAELVSGSLKLSSARENPFVIDGNYIDVYVGYADTISPLEAKISYELSGEGTAEIIEKDGTSYCMVTDSEGKSRGYKLNLIEKTYQLPVISIETENHTAITSKEEKIPGTLSMDYNGTETYSNLNDCTMVIRGRGHSSWKLPKKPYKIKFEEKVSLFGLTAAKEWVLQPNHADKSLIRNKLAMDMGNVLDEVLFTPHAYNVDVFVNGEYMGVYTLVEQIEVKDGRIPGEKDGTAVDTDYLLELGGDEEATSFGTNIFHGVLLKFIEIKNPDTDVISKEQYEYIRNYVKNADRAVMELNGYEEYIDVPSVIDWFILNEFSYNVDGTFHRSDYLLKKQGGKLYMATYWDYDYAFGNFWRDSAAFDEWICLGNENTDGYIEENWCSYLLQDPVFTAQLKERWAQVGDKLYRTAMNTIEEAEKNVAPSAEENFARWPGILGKKIQYEFKKTAAIKTYEGQLDYLRDYIKQRYEWMDKTIKGM